MSADKGRKMSTEEIKPTRSLKELLGDRMFDTEHALGMYADSYATLPAEGIYDKEALAPFMHVIESCHIYLIGLVPKVNFDDARQVDSELNLDFTVLGKSYTVKYDIPEGLNLKYDGTYHYLGDSSGKRYWPDPDELQARLNAVSGVIDFDVKYIGQAYGQDGSRNALDRLLAHETLQKISLKGVPADYKLTVLLLSIQPDSQLFTVFNPFAKNSDDEGARIKSGLDKLFNTSEQERVTLFEASLIRYFYPEFNKEFKDSFPSTNLKALKDCYDKDFSAIVVQICIDVLPFTLKSQNVAPTRYHIIQHDLHKAEDRKMFFSESDLKA